LRNSGFRDPAGDFIFWNFRIKASAFEAALWPLRGNVMILAPEKILRCGKALIADGITHSTRQYQAGACVFVNLLDYFMSEHELQK
jgi:hypothetical protein